jgi:hypothetical protein
VIRVAIQCSKCGLVVRVPEGTSHIWCCGEKTECKDGIRILDNQLAVPSPVVRRTQPCRHLGGEVTRRLCESCCGRVEIKIFGCNVHGNCTAKRVFGGIQDCTSCRDYEEPPPTVISCFRKPSNERSIGLGVNADLTATSLNDASVTAKALPVASFQDLASVLEGSPPKLIVLEGMWAHPDKLVALTREHPNTLFVYRCHSQIAFLQIEPDSIGRIRDVCTYSKTTPNLRLAGNNKRFAQWASEAWDAEVLYLPNLYPVETTPIAKPSFDGPVFLGSFGAMRLQKHHTMSAAVALILAKRLNREVRFYVNRDAGTIGGSAVMRSMEQMLKGTSVLFERMQWSQAFRFRKLVSQMHLCFQFSSSETFNLVTADAASAGVPSVVGEAIDWVPRDWFAPIDDPLAAADVACRVLFDPTAGERGRAALHSYAASALGVWRALL